MSQIINEAETAFSRQAFDVRSHAIAVIQQADFIAQGLIGKTFGQLNATERKFFTDSKTLIANWERGNRNIAKDFESLATTMEETVSRLPGGDKRPLVKRIVPSYISSGLIDETFFVSVEGSRIGAGEPSLAFSRNTCKRIGKTEREIKFECPAKIFSGLKKTTARSGTLLVVPPRSLIEVVLFQDATPVTYDVGIIGVPPNVGGYKASATVATETKEEQQRSFYFNHTNSHCVGTREYTELINASAGWQIVEASITVGGPGFSVASGCSGPTPRSVTSAGFQLYGKAVNSGNCLKVAGQVVSKDGRGWVKATVGWKEHRSIPGDAVLEISQGDLLWGSDRSFTLPSGAKGFTLAIRHFDGTDKIVTGGGDFKWYEVDYDQNTRVVVIRPKQLTEALST